jgi:hypothetical protein
MADSLTSSTPNSRVINRDSLSTNLEKRYKKSKIKEVTAPTPVTISSLFAKGFIMKNKLFTTDFTGVDSSFLKGFSNQKYSNK